MTQGVEYTPKLTCTRCNTNAPMAVLQKHSDIRRHEGEKHEMEWDAGEAYQLVLCPACHGICLCIYSYHQYLNEFGTYEMVYPASSAKELVGLPDRISGTWKAARKVKSIDANAFAVLLGRVLDLVCLDKKANGDSLSKRLQDLALRGDIPANLADVAHALRKLRNLGAHADLGDLSSSDIPVLEALSVAVLAYVYVAPQLAAIAEARFQILKKATP